MRMIDPTPYSECEFIENAIILTQEKAFLALANKPENGPYRFVHNELHPDEKKDQVIAHHFYVADTFSKKVFGFIELKIGKEEYEKIQDNFEE